MPSVGSLFATLSLDDAQYQERLKKAPGLASQTAAKINTAFNRQPGIDNAAKAVLGLTSDLKLQANALGLSIKSWDAFNAVATANKVSGGELIRTFSSLRGNLDQARGGSADAAAAFSTLGISWKSLARAKPDSALQQVARAMFVAGEGTAAYHAGLAVLNAQDHPRLQATLRTIARSDLGALGAAATRTGGLIRSELAGAFLKFAAPTAIIATLTKLTGSALRLAEQLKGNAAAAGLTTDKFQVLDYVARQNQASGADWIPVLARLRNTLQDAANGSDTANRSLADLGLRYQDLIDLSPDEQVATVARAMHAAGTGTRIFAAGADLLGTRNLPRLQASLTDIATRGLPALDDALDKSGQKMSAETVKRVEEAQQAIENLKRTITVFVGERIGGILLLASGEVEKLSETEKALERLIALRMRLNALTPEEAGRPTGVAVSNPASPGVVAVATGPSALDQLQQGRLAFARTVAAETEKLTAFQITLAQNELDAYRKTQDERGGLTADTAARVAAIEQQLAARRAELEKKATAAVEAAAKARETAVAASADQTKATISATFDLLDNELKQALAADLGAQGAALAQSLRTPFEEYQAAILEADQLLAHGIVTQETYNRAVRAAGDAFAAAAPNKTALEEYHETIAKLGRLLAEETISQEAYNEAVRAARQAVTGIRDPIEDYKAEVGRLDGLLAAGVITLEAYNSALRAAKDAAGGVKSPTEEYRDTVARLKAQHDAGIIGAKAYAKALRDAGEAAGSARLADIGRTAQIAGAGGSSKTERSINRALEKAKVNAARGNFGAVEENLRRAEELGGNVRGTSLEKAAGPRAIRPREIGGNEGKALRDQQRQDEFDQFFGTRYFKPGGAAGAARGAAAGTPGAPPLKSGGNDKNKTDSPGDQIAKLLTSIDTLVTTLNDLPSKVGVA